MAKSEYQRYLEAPDEREARHIAAKAHMRVVAVFDDLTDDQKIPNVVRDELSETRSSNYFDKVLARIVHTRK